MADDNYIKQLIEMIKRDYGSVHNYNKACMMGDWLDEEEPRYVPKEYLQKAYRQRKRLHFGNESELLFRDHEEEPLRGSQEVHGLEIDLIAVDEFPAWSPEPFPKMFPGRNRPWCRHVRSDKDDTAF